MKIKLFIIFLFSLSTQLFAESQQYVNPWPDAKLKDIEKATSRVIQAIDNNERIGIIADYDVDGSTSASILFKFLKNFTSSIILKIPNRLVDGYGPNIKLMKEMLDSKVDLLLTLDCGTTSNDIIDNKEFKKFETIINS